MARLMEQEATGDPSALLRAALAQWERLTNDYGSQFLQRPETAGALQGFTTAMLQIREVTQDAMGKALAVANMPSKTDFDALAARMAAIEASLARIEAATVRAPGSLSPPRPRPRRTRKPPVPS